MTADPLEGQSPHPEAHGGAKPPASDPAEVVAGFWSFLRTVTPTVWVVPAIIAVNVAALGVMIASGVRAFDPKGDDLIRWGADYGPRTLGGEPWRMLTNTFLHFGVIHLAMNMVALWDAGRPVERIFGHARFAALYLAAGLCGSVASLAFHPHGASAGASGAVFGVYGALGAFLLRERGTVPAPVLSKLGRVAIAFIGYNVVIGFAHPSIDAAAHLGGLAGGAAAGAWLARPLAPGRRERGRRPAAVAALAVAIAAFALVALPRPGDLKAVLERFSADEKRIVETYNALLTRARDGGAPDSAFAAGLQADVIDPWHDARLRLSAPGRWEPRQREFVDVLVRYATAREEAWTSLAAAARSGDRSLLEESRKHEAEAQRAMEELASFGK